jgi:multidrug efflux system membrane fusion protein
VVAILLAAGAYFAWPALSRLQSTESPQPGKSGKGKKGSGSISVVAVKAKKGNVSVYLTGLGTVTPNNTVAVKSRVDGQLVNVLFREGQIVQKGDLLVEIDSRPFQVQLDQAEGQLIKDQALVRNARLDEQRYQTLYGQKIIAQQQLTTQQALVSQYDGAIKADEAAVTSAKLNLEYCRITSPLTGMIGLRLVDSGNIVHAADANGMLVVTQLNPISVIFTTAEDQLPPVLQRFRHGQTLRVDAWDRDLKNKLAAGKLETTDNQIDPTTGTLKLRAIFDNQEGALFPSQFVNTRMLVEQRSGVTLVPNSAIQRNSQNTYIWLLNPDQTVSVRNVMLGATEGDQTEIAEGIEPGDSVITVGVDKLQNGSRVRTQGAGGGKSRKGAK